MTLYAFIIYLQGCSASLNQPTQKKQPLCNNMMVQNVISNSQSVKTSQSHNMCTDNKQNSDNIHVNSTDIVIFAQDAKDSCRTNDNNNTSTDSSSVVPILRNEKHHNSGRNNYDSCFHGFSDHRQDTTHKDANSNNVQGVKSVLKTNRNDIPSHMIASRPIKSVTFVDSVTVVTVY